MVTARLIAANSVIVLQVLGYGCVRSDRIEPGTHRDLVTHRCSRGFLRSVPIVGNVEKANSSLRIPTSAYAGTGRRRGGPSTADQVSRIASRAASAGRIAS